MNRLSPQSITGVIVFLFCILQSGFAQKPTPHIMSADEFVYPEPYFESYDQEIDSNNYLLIAHSGGILTFNGYKLHKKEFNNSSRSLLCTALFKDAKKRIWASSKSNGFGMLTPNGFQPYKYAELTKPFDKSVKEAFYVDLENRLHLAPRGLGYFTISNDSVLTEVMGRSSGHHGFFITYLPDGTPFHFSVLQKQKLKDKESMSVYFIDKKGAIHNLAKLPSTAPIFESSLVAHTDGALTLSVGTKDLITIHQDSVLQHIEFPYPVLKLFIDRENNLWVGTVNGGIHLISDRNFSETEILLPGAAAAVVAQDKDGGLWAKSNRSSFHYIPHSDLKSYSKKKGTLKFFRMHRIAADRDRVICFSSNNELTILEPDSIRYLTIPVIPPLPGRRAQTSLPTSLQTDTISNKIWLGYWGQVKSWDGKVWTSYQLPEEKIKNYRVIQMMAMPDSSLWGITGLELFHIPPEGEVEVYSFPDQQIKLQCFAADADGTFWLGSDKGMWKWKAGLLTPYSPSEEFADSLQFQIDHISYSNGYLWVETQHKGLYAIQGKEVIQILSPQGEVMDMSELVVGPNGALWGRSRGNIPYIQRFTLKDGKPHCETVPFQVLNRYGDGFSEQTLAITPNGIYSGLRDRIHFSSLDGTKTATSQPSIVLQKVFFNREEVTPQSSYDISYDKQLILFRINKVSYRSTKQIIQFRLLGWDDKWQTSEQLDIQYTNLPPGDYQFQVQTKLESDEWREGIQVDLHIQTPFWQTWWFLSLMLLVLILFIGSVFFVWNRIKLRRASLVIEKLTAEQRALRAQMNPHFLFNALSSIQELVYSKDRLSALTNIAMFAKLMRKILAQSSLELVTISEEAETLELYLQLESLRFEDNFQYSLTIDPLINAEKQLIPPVLIQPFVENAIKHGLLNKEPVSGSVEIHFKLRNNCLVCLIEDNGIGRKKSAEIKANRKAAHQSFGTQSVLDRIHLLNLQRQHHIELTIHDLEDANQLGCGTRVELTLPNNN